MIFKTTALADELERFFSAALQGEIQTSTDRPAPFRIGSQKTPISFGLSEGYTHQDIAHFYITRVLGEGWRVRILEHLSLDFLKKIDEALESFRKDSAIEIEHMRSIPLDVPF